MRLSLCRHNVRSNCIKCIRERFAPGVTEEQHLMVRRTDPPTSRAAAERVRPYRSALQKLVVEVYRSQGPMTAKACEKLPEFTFCGASSVRKRISELQQAGVLSGFASTKDGTVYRLKASA